MIKNSIFMVISGALMTTLIGCASTAPYTIPAGTPTATINDMLMINGNRNSTTVITVDNGSHTYELFNMRSNSMNHDSKPRKSQAIEANIPLKITYAQSDGREKCTFTTFATLEPNHEYWLEGGFILKLGRTFWSDRAFCGLQIREVKTQKIVSKKVS